MWYYKPIIPGQRQRLGKSQIQGQFRLNGQLRPV